MKRFGLISAIALTFLSPRETSCQPVSIDALIVGPVLQPGAPPNFGNDVAVNDEYLVVGSPLEGATPGPPIKYRGAFYVYHLSAGNPPTQIAHIMGATTSSRLGLRVALDGNALAVGAPFEDIGASTQAGAVYVYTLSPSSVSLSATLTAGTGVANELFGHALDMRNGWLAVGAPNASPSGGGQQESGAAHLFQQQGGSWAHVTSLSDSNGKKFDDFGISVAIDFPRLAVGQRRYDGSSGGTTYVNTGRVLLYKNNGNWPTSPTSTLNPPASFFSPTQTEPKFGTAVALEGDRLVVGSTGYDSPSPNTGIVHVYREQAGGWQQEGEPLMSDPIAGAEFGVSVAICSETVYVGAYMEPAVYSHRFSGSMWYRPFAKLTPPPIANDYGIGIDCSPGRLAVGARLYGQVGNEAGAAYLLKVDPSFPEYGNGCVSSCGQIPVLSGTGQLVAGSTVRFVVQGAAVSPGVWFFGTGMGSAPLNPSCSVEILPLATPSGFSLPLSGGQCELGTSIALPVPPGFPQGVGLTTQVLMLDLSAPGGISATNALQL